MTLQVSKRTQRTGAGRRCDAEFESFPERLEQLATRVEVAAGETLYEAGDAADAWYRLIAGAACESVQTVSGERQIVDFLLPGDLVGFCSEPRYESSVAVIADGTVFARYPRRQAEELASVDAEVAQAVRQRAFESISRLQSRIVLLGRTNSLEKVSAFLLEMAARTPAGESGDLLLPMSRYDIADYLAMAVETVSRALTTLKARGAISIEGPRHVRIVDRHALKCRGAAAAARHHRSDHRGENGHVGGRSGEEFTVRREYSRGAPGHGGARLLLTRQACL
jgi:CRP/FNR family nitrogen fixation transcriptional regulator